MATLQEKIYEHEDFFINKILYPMTKRKFDTLNQGAKKRTQEAEEEGITDTNKLKEIQKLLATAPNWQNTEFINNDVQAFMDKCKRKFDNNFEEYIDSIKEFVCDIYVETARNLWDSVELYTDSCSNVAKDKNQEQIKKIIIESVKNKVKQFEVPDKFNALSELLDTTGGSKNENDGNDDDGNDDIENKSYDSDSNDSNDEEDSHDGDSYSDSDDDIEMSNDSDDNKGENDDEDDEDEESIEKDGDEGNDDAELKSDGNDDDDKEVESGNDSDTIEIDFDSKKKSIEEKQTYDLDKPKVNDIMKQAEQNIEKDPDLTDENIENFLKFKKFLEMTKKANVDNFEEILQKALERPVSPVLETYEAHVAPISSPKPIISVPTIVKKKKKVKEIIVEPSFEEIVEEESLGLFDAPLKPPPPSKKGRSAKK